MLQPWSTIFHMQCWTDMWNVGRLKKRLRRFRTVFNNKREKKLSGYLQFMDSLRFDERRVQEKYIWFFRKKIEFLTIFRIGAAGDDWLLGFIRRHTHINLYLPEPTSAARSRGNKHPKVTYFLYFPVVTSTKAQNRHFTSLQHGWNWHTDFNEESTENPFHNRK